MRTTSRMCALPRDSVDTVARFAMAAAGSCRRVGALIRMPIVVVPLRFASHSRGQSVLHKYSPRPDGTARARCSSLASCDARMPPRPASCAARSVPRTMRARRIRAYCRLPDCAIIGSEAACSVGIPGCFSSSPRPDRDGAPVRRRRRGCRPGSVLAKCRIDPRHRLMFGFGKDNRILSADAKIGGALVRVAPRQRPARDPARGARRARQARRADTRAARRKALEAVFRVDSDTEELARDADRAVPRAREPLVADREPALAGAVRPHAGFLACYARIRARGRRARAEQQMAGAAARAASRARSRTSASTRGSASSATSSGSRRNGPSCTRCSRSRARARSSGSRVGRRRRRATRRRSSTST